MKALLTAVMLVFIAAPALSLAQTTGKIDAHREANFLYEVKIIDEFIERFNDDPASALRKEYARAGKHVPFTRRDLINYLFEPPARIQDLKIKKFVDQVADSLHPQLLSFNDTDWYAQVQCAFSINGRKVTLPLVLQVNTAADKSAKWMIAGIGDSYIFRNEVVAPAAAIRQKTARQTISPSEYATNFLELHHILAAGMDASNFFLPELLSTEKGKKFVQLIQSKKLSFDYPGTMKFYFFQIPNYMFTVERFVRNTTHSGWLISGLNSVTVQEKQVHKQQLLQRTL